MYKLCDVFINLGQTVSYFNSYRTSVGNGYMMIMINDFIPVCFAGCIITQGGYGSRDGDCQCISLNILVENLYFCSAKGNKLIQA